MGAACAQTLVVLPVAFCIRRAFDVAIPGKDLAALAVLATAVLALGACGAALSLWARHAVLGSTKWAVRRLRRDLLLRGWAMSRSAWDRRDHGVWRDAVVQDTERLDIMANALFAVVLPSAVLSAGLVVVACSLSLPLFLVLLVVGPLHVLVDRLLVPRLRARTEDYRHAFESFSSGVHFVSRAMVLTRALGAEDGELARQELRLDALRLTSHRMAWLQTAYGQLQGLVATSVGLCVLVVGGALVSTGHATMGELLSFYVVAGLLRAQLQALLGAVPQVVTGESSLRSIHALLGEDDRRPYGGTGRPDWSGALRFEGVRFGYDEGREVLAGIDLELLPGDRLALTGANGSGKSTLLDLVLAFHRPTAGRLLFDGIPLDEIDPVWLRGRIAWLPQDPFLFRGTVRENVAYGRGEIPPEELEEAARIAGALDLIRSLPDGWETAIGEGGVFLSGGQRQRLALLRALVGAPRLLLLDEPGNHLDEGAISSFLDRLHRARPELPVLVASHDPLVLTWAGRVLRLAEGRLVPAGVAEAGT